MVLVVKKHATSSLEVFKNRLHFSSVENNGVMPCSVGSINQYLDVFQPCIFKK